MTDRRSVVEMKAIEQLPIMREKSQEWSPEHRAKNFERCLSIVAKASKFPTIEVTWCFHTSSTTKIAGAS